MHLHMLELEEFRLYRRLHLVLDPAGMALHGANASGKSTLLEAIAMLATTRSSRSGTERELIAWASGQDDGLPPFARVKGTVERRDGPAEVEIAVQADAQGVNPLQKAIRLNGRNVRAMDAVGALKIVLFAPDDVALVTGSPSGRRRYLDLMISQLDGRYLRALARYNRILEQRNSLLKSLSRDGINPNAAGVDAQLSYWDEELVAFGSRIVARRATTIARLAGFAATRFTTFGDDARLRLAYLPSVGPDAVDAAADGVTGDALQSVVSRGFAERLRESRRDELRRGMSLIGPHRDDLGLTLNEVDLATYGSRGQQRLAVVATKLAETDLMHEESGEHPVVLLDDVLSELDVRHRARLLEAIALLGAQVIVTATEIELLRAPLLERLPRAEVRSGKIEVNGGLSADTDTEECQQVDESTIVEGELLPPAVA